jgi:hypothetical protein
MHRINDNTRSSYGENPKDEFLKLFAQIGHPEITEILENVINKPSYSASPDSLIFKNKQLEAGWYDLLDDELKMWGDFVLQEFGLYDLYNSKTSEVCNSGNDKEKILKMILKKL